MRGRMLAGTTGGTLWTAFAAIACAEGGVAGTASGWVAELAREAELDVEAKAAFEDAAPAAGRITRKDSAEMRPPLSMASSRKVTSFPFGCHEYAPAATSCLVKSTRSSASPS